VSPQFEALYHQHVMASFEKQLHFADVIGERGWSFSMSDGHLTFSNRDAAPMAFAAQLLGSAANGDRSWLWSWANEASNIPRTLTEDARRLRQDDSAPEWATPQFALDFDNADEHRLAMTACSVLGAAAYYRGPYEGGAAFFLLHDHRLLLPPPAGPRIIRTAMQAISKLPVADHRAAIMGYFTARRLEPRVDADNSIVATLGGSDFRAKFDQQGRLADLSGTLKP
jgi:hypothetical protein